MAADKGAKIAKQYDALLMMRPGWSDRTSYVIAPSGKITHVYSALSPNKHVQETLDAVKALEQSKPAARQRCLRDSDSNGSGDTRARPLSHPCDIAAPLRDMRPGLH